MHFKDNKRGSSTVILAMVFVTLSLCICGAIEVSRMLVAGSECKVFGELWTKAILSEYDRHLLENYGIMAYFGNEAEVQKKLNMYLDYSSSSKIDEKIGGISAELTGFELGDTDNFRKALRQSSLYGSVEDVRNNKHRSKRDNSVSDGDNEDRRISNPIVLNTLPSAGNKGSVNAVRIADRLQDKDAGELLDTGLGGLAAEYGIIIHSFGNHLTNPGGREDYFVNEWEYILYGKNDDGENYKSCRKTLFAVRNALNFAYLEKDTAKKELIIAVSEMITPGAGAVITQALITEIWAAIETEEDMKTLTDGGNVPIIKTAGSWKTSLSSVIHSQKLQEKLDEEAKMLLAENEGEIADMKAGQGSPTGGKTGLDYDEYLLLMLSFIDDDTRILRIMDLIQINMKYRYYRDFNMMEYYTGVRYCMKANGRSYEFEESYK